MATATQLKEKLDELLRLQLPSYIGKDEQVYVSQLTWLRITRTNLEYTLDEIETRISILKARVVALESA